MKRFKMSIGVLALALAIGSSFASTKPFHKVVDFKWHRYSGSTSSPTITLVPAESDADAQNECSTGAFKCMVRLDANDNEITPVYFRPAQP